MMGVAFARRSGSSPKHGHCKVLNAEYRMSNFEPQKETQNLETRHSLFEILRFKNLKDSGWS